MHHYAVKAAHFRAIVHDLIFISFSYCLFLNNGCCRSALALVNLWTFPAGWASFDWINHVSEQIVQRFVKVTIPRCATHVAEKSNPLLFIRSTYHILTLIHAILKNSLCLGCANLLSSFISLFFSFLWIPPSLDEVPTLTVFIPSPRKEFPPDLKALKQSRQLKCPLGQ